jgi:GAF domain-containing protein
MRSSEGKKRRGQRNDAAALRPRAILTGEDVPADLRPFFQATCRTGVDLFKADHCAFVRFDAGGTQGTVIAEYPDLGTIGIVITVTGVRREERLVREGKTICIPDVSRAKGLGSVKDTLRDLNIQSCLLVPVVIDDKTVGSFSLDFLTKRRQFSGELIQRCEIFANHLGWAIAHAEHAAELRALRDLTLKLTTERDKQALLVSVIKAAVTLLHGESGGIYEYRPGQRTLRVVAESGRTHSVLGTTLSEGEGLAGRLVSRNVDYGQVSDYAGWSGRASRFEGRPFGAVVEVLLRWQSETVGVLWVDGRQGREFSDQEIALLRLLADHAAIAIHDIQASDRDATLVKRLEKLSRASSEILGGIAEQKFDDLLDVIARITADLLEAESAALFLSPEQGMLSLEACFGHRNGAFEKGRRLPISDADGSGLTGFIAARGKLFNEAGEGLRKHHAINGSAPVHTSSGKCESLLAIPLKSRGSSRVLGVLRADNKTSREGHVEPGVTFDHQDEVVISLLADVAAAAIEDALLMLQLTDRSARLQSDVNAAQGDLQLVAVDVGRASLGRTLVVRTVHQVKNLLGDLQLVTASLVGWAESERVSGTSMTVLRRTVKSMKTTVDAINEFLDILGSVEDTTSTEWLDLNEAVDRILRILEYRFRTEGVDVTFERDDDLPEVSAQNLALLEVLYNMITNALNAMVDRPQRQLTLRTARTADHRWVELRITDTGVGVPSDYVERIWAPRFTRSRSVPGRKSHGLGLTGIRDVIELRFRGKVRLQESRVGHGSTFVVLLRPRSDQTASEAE